MKMILDVRMDGMHFSGGASVEIEEAMQYTFEPINTCDDPLLTPINGEFDAGSYEVQKVIKVRDGYANYLAEQLARLIIKEMSKNDTHNGYKD